MCAPERAPVVLALFVMPEYSLFGDAVQKGEMQREYEDIEKYLRVSRDRSKGYREERPDSMDETYGEMRARLMLRAQRSVDHLQISIGQAWRQEVAAMCLIGSAIFSAILMIFLLVGDPSLSGASVLTIIGVAILSWIVATLAGALAAPVAHDLMRAVRSFSRR